MSKFIYDIYYSPGFKLGKPNGLSRHLREKKSGMDKDFFGEGELLDLKKENIGVGKCNGMTYHDR